MKTNLKLNQRGRSMVEMMGVLAIIGVLSVAGVQGYTTAMNKHRANEILNEASKRAIVVASQIASGRTPTLTEFTDNEVGGATFDPQVKNASGGDWTTEDSQFKIGFDVDPSDAVLAQMKNIAGENGMIKSFDGGLTYNNDLTAGNGTGAEGGEDPTPIDPEVNECTGNTKPKSEGTGCECKPGYKESDCMECASGYGIDSDDKCVACPSNSANDGDTAQETNVSGCYCNSGYEWDSTECKAKSSSYQIVGDGNLSYYDAVTACPDGWTLAAISDVQEAAEYQCGDLYGDGSAFSCNPFPLIAKFGLSMNDFLWLSDTRNDYVGYLSYESTGVYLSYSGLDGNPPGSRKALCIK